MNRLINWFKGKAKTFKSGTRDVWYTPDGKANPSDECYMCKRRPEIYEDAFTIWFGKVVCEYCFWSDKWFNEHHGNKSHE